MGVKKILVGLLEENRQLKADALKYEQLFLEMEQKNWNLEDELGKLKQHLREIDQMPEKKLAEPIPHPPEWYGRGSDADPFKAEEPIAELDCGD